MFKYQKENQQNGKSSEGKQSYRPAVPIAVYRELANELQTTKSELATLKAENQQLVQQNQIMRQELDKISQCVQTFQQVKGQGNVGENPSLTFDRPVAISDSPGENIPASPVESESSFSAEPAFEEVKDEEYVIEVDESSRRRFNLFSNAGDASNWLLAIAIFLMILTAFGTSFLFIRPWLNNNDNG